MKIRIGTRASKLALWQANYIAGLLQQGGLETEIVPMETKGDKIQNVSLSKIGSKGVFTQELEEQLRSGQIDIAVHSAKDMQSHLDDDLELIAFTERECVNDALVSFDKSVMLNATDRKLIVGTSSTRRRAMLRRFYPHVQLVESRGNLQTRMRKMEEGQCDALLLAYAGIHRMGYDAHIVRLMPLDEFTPAVGQGSITIEAATSLAPELRNHIRNLTNHPATEACLLAERTFLKTLQGGCSIPVFGLASVEAGLLTLKGGIISLDGKAHIQVDESGTDPQLLGETVANQVLAQGGDVILANIKKGLAQ